MRWGFLVAAAVWLAGAACARADAGVILFERAGLRPDLCAALRIQLADVAPVACEAADGAEELSPRIAHAAARTREAQARFGLLLERDPDPRLVRMYIVSAKQDEAVIAIERIHDRPQPDVDRSLALKVRDAYDVVTRVSAAVAATHPGPTEPAPLAAIVTRLPEPQRPVWSTTLWLEAGAAANLGSSPRALGQVALGFGRARKRFVGELGVGARQLTSIREKLAVGEVHEAERGPFVTLRSLWVGDGFATGGTFDVTAWFANAQGSTRDGARGEQTNIVWALAPGLDLRVRLFTSAYLRFSPSLEILVPRQRFAVSNTTLVDVGRVRLLVPLSLLVGLPLGARP